MNKILQAAALALMLVPSVSLAQGFDAGVRAAQAGDFETALKEWRPLAEQGKAKAQYNLGVMYANGQGVPRDYGKAYMWWRLAAEQGHDVARYNLGVMYETRPRVLGVISKIGRRVLGVMFAKGEGVPQDYVEAVKWWRLAAEQGNALAQYNLGVMFAKGKGVPQDYVEAHKWYRLAAEQGTVRALNNLGVMYDNGQGVPTDYQTAHMWYNIWSQNGSEAARRNRDKTAKKMTPQDIFEAARRARVCMDSNYQNCD